jgi:ABC-type multidrug transport system permease subunit
VIFVHLFISFPILPSFFYIWPWLYSVLPLCPLFSLHLLISEFFSSGTSK